MKKLLVLTVLSFLLSVTNLFADCTTTISGGIIVNQTWTQEGSPYCVDGDIFIESLVIEPGVRVEFSGNYVLEVEGVLTAIGSEGAPILFTKADAADGWQGILFDHTPAGSQLKHCQIEYSINSGIRIIDSIQVIENCSIANNHSDNCGGGISISLTSSTNELVLKDCRISSNTSLTHGGGMYINASTGALTLINCEINNNRNNKNSNNGNYYGGGIYCASAAAKLSLINCKVRDNHAYSRCRSRWCGASCYGGGVYLSKGNILFNNCIIDSNFTSAIANESATEYGYSYGAGIYQSKGVLLLTNCIISNNSPVASADKIYERGGGVYTDDATISIENCTIAYNTKQGVYNSDGIVTANNSIVYWNSGASFYGNATVNYCDVEGGWASGQGNVEDPPVFDSVINLTIESGSPCIDAGDPNPKYNDIYFPPSLGTERNDIGAHGGPGARYEFPFVDSDGDGVPNQWDTCPDTPENSAIYSNGCVAEDLYAQIADKDQTIVELNATIASMFTQEQLDQAVAAKDQIIAQNDQTISDLNSTIDSMFTQEQFDQGVQSERRRWDINDDNRKGLEEAIDALQVTSGVRNPQ